MKSFNLFRVNCLLNDSKSSNFNSILLSLVHEFFYEHGNKPKDIIEVYNYITGYLKIIVEFDFLESLIERSNQFILEPTVNSFLLTIKPKKFQEIEITIHDNSIEKYIKEFLIHNKIDLSFQNSIEKLIYLAVYENINSLSEENFKNLISLDSETDFTKDEIEVYNSFLDYNNVDKNRAIFNILSRAVEFAILTSGKGIREMRIEVYNDKSFLLDTNIIFRLIGIGGKERKNSTFNLLKKCREIGIEFQYTGKTHTELHNKLDQIIGFLNSKKTRDNIELLGELALVNPDLLKDDFIVHYASLRQQEVVKTPEQYQRYILATFQKLLQELGISLVKENANENNVLKFAKELFKKKREMGIQYGKKASEVDANNLLIVRQKRGQNNYNFSNVKSFYLTSDRSLNTIASSMNKGIIPETILPSQLYILCKPFFSNNDEFDYEEFIKFIKRRKTGFKYAGSQVLNYISSIQELTADVYILSESLILYSDIRFRNISKNQFESETFMPSYKTVLQTLIDKKLVQGEEANEVFDSLKNQYFEFSNIRFKIGLIFTRFVDLVITIGIIPAAIFFVKLLHANIVFIFLLILILESMKFIVSSRFLLLPKIYSQIYKSLTKVRIDKASKIHPELVKIISTKKELKNNNIWGKQG